MRLMTVSTSMLTVCSICFDFYEGLFLESVDDGELGAALDGPEGDRELEADGPFGGLGVVGFLAGGGVVEGEAIVAIATHDIELRPALVLREFKPDVLNFGFGDGGTVVETFLEGGGEQSFRS